jgi:peptidoglycan/xylan/chitin deacetylase (PgdA/CDA1 family)
MPPPVILLYHRVASDPLDAHVLCVSVANFIEQLDYLATTAHVVSLAEMVKALAENRLQDGMVAISFDDGYRDNLTVAAPLLQAYGFPATLFVTTGFLGHDGYWIDRLERMFFNNPALPESVVAESRARSLRRPSQVLRAHDSTHAFLRNLHPMQIHQRLEAFGQALCHDGAPPPTRPFLTKADLRDISAKYPRITIGAHTVNHPYLPKLSFEDQAREVQASRMTLQALTSQEVAFFAYPYGEESAFDALTIHVCQRSGYRAAFSNVRSPVTAARHHYAIPRARVCNWHAEQFHAWREAAFPAKYFLAALTERNQRLLDHLRA